MEKYFVTTMNNYASTNSLQRKGIEALKWLDKILVDDLAALESEIRDCVCYENSLTISKMPFQIVFSLH